MTNETPIHPPDSNADFNEVLNILNDPSPDVVIPPKAKHEMEEEEAKSEAVPACRGVRSCSGSTKACGAGSGSGDASKGSPASSLAFRLAAAASRRLCEMAAAI